MCRNLNAIVITMLVTVVGLGVGLALTQHPQVANAHTRTVTFAGGCFWGLEAAFRQVPGVTDTVVGYTGNAGKSPASEDIDSRRVSHLEACRVTYDPSRVSYQQLVKYFLEVHDGSITDRKSPYLGSPVRLVIFFQNPEERKIADAAKAQFSQTEGIRHIPLIQVLSEGSFDKAEEYNQRYLEKHGLVGCRIGS